MPNHNAVPLQGACDRGFERVKGVFIENFKDRGEIGAAVCVYHFGKKVVDLWGGYTDLTRSSLWQEDTTVCMMSVGKAMASLCMWMLIDRGQVELTAKVADYWPEFGQAGKENMTVEHLLGGFAGLLYLDNAPPGCLLDRKAMIKAIETQAPLWPIGTQGAYHSVTWGYLLTEILQRVDGREFGAFFRQEVSEPLGADYQMGLTDEELLRVVDIIPNTESATLNAMANPESNIGRAWRVMPKDANFFNCEEFRRAVLPSANGHGNARAIARIYALLAEGGELDDVRLLSAETVDLARQLRWEGDCGLTGRAFKFASGFFLNKPPLNPMGANPRAFGHPGAGGAMGIADPEARISFSYSPNYMCAGEGVDKRCAALVEAALGHL